VSDAEGIEKLLGEMSENQGAGKLLALEIMYKGLSFAKG